jgi:hypothetical protein
MKKNEVKFKIKKTHQQNSPSMYGSIRTRGTKKMQTGVFIRRVYPIRSKMQI